MAESALPLVERLRAALDRAEEIARAATAGPWTTTGPDTIAQWGIYDTQWRVATAEAYDHDEPLSNRPGARGPGYIDADANAAHIAENDPAHVLRTVAAHRKILDEHALLELTYWPTAMCSMCADPDATAVDDPMGSDCPWTPNQSYPCATLRALASIYFPEGTEP